jgi:hypothetical protein
MLQPIVSFRDRSGYFLEEQCYEYICVSFQNLGASVETVILHTNRLKHLDVETFVALQSIRSLQVS